MTDRPTTEPRPTAHTFDQINWDNAEQETRIGVLQEMVAILLNELDSLRAEAAQGAAPLPVDDIAGDLWHQREGWHAIEGAAPRAEGLPSEPRWEVWARLLAPLVHDGLIDTRQAGREIPDKAFYLARLLDEHLTEGDSR